MREGNLLKRSCLCAVVAAICIAVLPLRSRAAEGLELMQMGKTEDALTLYITGDATQKAKVQIGTEYSVGVTVQTIDDTLPIITWVLVDNSLSITKADREATKALVTSLAASRLPNEAITLCTVSDQLHILVEESRNYVELKTQIDSITYSDQETYLTDMINEVLNQEASRQGAAYVRCIVISDGIDNNPNGITREELIRRLSEEMMPIYTVGCTGGDDALKAMYALSRLTGAESWSMAAASDTLKIAEILGTTEVPQQIEIPLPDVLRDGTTKGICVTFENGESLEVQATMPFGTVEKAEAPIEVPEEVPTEPVAEPEQHNSLPVLLICGIVGLAGILALAVFLFRKRAEKQRVKPVTETVNTFSGPTEFLGGENDDGGTQFLVGERTYMLSLTDTEHPERCFELPLCGEVYLGRNTENQVVVDYDRSVSGTHCKIVAENGSVRVHDLHSKNGTFVNNTQVANPREIVSGSIIKLGRVSLKVELR